MNFGILLTEMGQRGDCHRPKLSTVITGFCWQRIPKNGTGHSQAKANFACFAPMLRRAPAALLLIGHFKQRPPLRQSKRSMMSQGCAWPMIWCKLGAKPPSCKAFCNRRSFWVIWAPVVVRRRSPRLARAQNIQLPVCMMRIVIEAVEFSRLYTARLSEIRRPANDMSRNGYGKMGKLCHASSDCPL